MRRNYLNEGTYVSSEMDGYLSFVCPKLKGGPGLPGKRMPGNQLQISLSLEITVITSRPICYYPSSEMKSVFLQA